MPNWGWQAIRWTPRVASILMALSLAIFALDVFGQGQSFWMTIAGFLVHLIPTFILLAASLIGWRWPVIGGVIFLGWAVFYLISMRGNFDLSTYLIIAGIPAVIGLLFLLSVRNPAKRSAG